MAVVHASLMLLIYERLSGFLNFKTTCFQILGAANIKSLHQLLVKLSITQCNYIITKRASLSQVSRKCENFKNSYLKDHMCFFELNNSIN